MQLNIVCFACSSSLSGEQDGNPTQERQGGGTLKWANLHTTIIGFHVLYIKFKQNFIPHIHPTQTEVPYTSNSNRMSSSCWAFCGEGETPLSQAFTHASYTRLPSTSSAISNTSW